MKNGTNKEIKRHLNSQRGKGHSPYFRTMSIAGFRRHKNRLRKAYSQMSAMLGRSRRSRARLLQA